MSKYYNMARRFYGRAKGYSGRTTMVGRGYNVGPRRRINYRINRLERGYGKELKTHDGDYTTPPDDTGIIVPLTLIAQGTQSINRIGLNIKPRSFQWKLTLQVDSSAIIPTYIRFIIFVDREQSGVIPTVAQLMESTDINAFPEHDTRPRFKILVDRRCHLGDIGSNIAPDAKMMQGFRKFGKYFKTWYSGTAATQANQGKNNLYAYILSNQPTNSPAINFAWRMRFVDS